MTEGTAVCCGKWVPNSSVLRQRHFFSVASGQSHLFSMFPGKFCLFSNPIPQCALLSPSNGHRHAINRILAPRPPRPSPPRPPPRQAPAPPTTLRAALLRAGRGRRRRRGLGPSCSPSRRGAGAARAAGGFQPPRRQPQQLQRDHLGHRLARRAIPCPGPQQKRPQHSPEDICLDQLLLG